MLQLKNLTKWYPSANGRKYVFRDLDLSFPAGANIGLIGRNGAGKSTLMNLLGGIDTPNAGQVLTDRRISWPVGLRGGFQQTLTGRENVQFVCRVYGATGKLMREKVEFVEQFAEIGDFFNLPVRSYSAGMRSRVAFGLSMAFDFDYYLVDEVLAVGDAEFKRKSHEVLSERLKTSNLILVSHSMTPIRAYCNAVVLVERDRVTLFHDVEAGIAAYQRRPEGEEERAAPVEELRAARRLRREKRDAAATPPAPREAREPREPHEPRDKLERRALRDRRLARGARKG